LLAKTLAVLEDHCQYTRAILDEAHDRVSTLRRRSVLTTWHRVANNAKDDRRLKEKNAIKYGKRLMMRRAIQAWHSGVKNYQEEREMDILIEAKWVQVQKWFDE